MSRNPNKENQKSYRRPTAASENKRETLSTDKLLQSARGIKSKTKKQLNYQTILDKLLACETLHDFKIHSSNYISFLSHKPIQGKTGANRITNLEEIKHNKEVSDHILADGTFLKHYCELLLSSPEGSYFNHSVFRKEIYESYKDKIHRGKDPFNDYFKVQRTRSLKKFGKHESQSKIRNSNLFQDYNQNEQTAEIQQNQAEDPTRKSAIKDRKSKKLCASGPKKRVTMNFQEIDEDESYHKSRKSMTQSERDRRYSGLQSSKDVKKNSYGRKSVIISFEDRLRTDKRLQQIHSQICEREKKRRESIQSGIKEGIKTIQEMFSKLKNTKPIIRDLTPTQLSGLSNIESELISKFPKVDKVTNQNEIEIACQEFIGEFKGLQIFMIMVKRHIFGSKTNDYDLYRGVTFRKQCEEALQEDNIPDQETLRAPVLYVQSQDFQKELPEL